MAQPPWDSGTVLDKIHKHTSAFQSISETLQSASSEICFWKCRYEEIADNARATVDISDMNGMSTSVEVPLSYSVQEVLQKAGIGCATDVFVRPIGSTYESRIPHIDQDKATIASLSIFHSGSIRINGKAMFV